MSCNHKPVWSTKLVDDKRSKKGFNVQPVVVCLHCGVPMKDALPEQVINVSPCNFRGDKPRIGADTCTCGAYPPVTPKAAPISKWRAFLISIGVSQAPTPLPMLLTKCDGFCYAQTPQELTKVQLNELYGRFGVSTTASDPDASKGGK